MVHSTSEFHLRELARKLKISFPWVRKTVLELGKEGLLIVQKIRGQTIVKANRENNTYKIVKRSYNLFSLYETNFIQKLKKVYNHPNAIILFGSYSLGEDVEGSDIDIAIITTRKEKIDFTPLEKKLHRKIKILELHPKKIEKEFITTLANGIVLEGYFELP
tara:strand:- start:504 stop:989 length:486 start_codon:yes stop_codon:yes gene_type:complete